MVAHEQIVAGLSCGQVLALLSDFVDGELEPATRNRVATHLQSCNWCERFGGRFSNVVAQLRRELEDPEPLRDDMAERLREMIRSAGG